MNELVKSAFLGDLRKLVRASGQRGVTVEEKVSSKPKGFPNRFQSPRTYLITKQGYSR